MRVELAQGFDDYTEDDYTEDDYYYEYTGNLPMDEGDMMPFGMEGGGGFKNKTFKSKKIEDLEKI